MLSYEDNVRAILESNLTEIKDEILDTIVKNILNLKEDTKTAEPLFYSLKDLKNVREAIKKVTSGDLYDAKGYLTKEGYKALETLEGLDLFWICDPEIKLVKKEG